MDQMTERRHPASEELVAFGLGKLDPPQSAVIEEHLSDCEECCNTLLNLADDTFSDVVRHAERAKVESDSAEAATEVLLGVDRQAAESVLPAALLDHSRYHVDRMVGRGGMGDVYRAEHRLMNRTVALKLINEQLVQNPQAVSRFRREVQAAAQLSHPNIVAAYDAEQAGGTHFLVMEFVEGTDLATVVTERGPLSIQNACRYACQAAAGLQHAHERGMIHRDLKPHNLMLSSDGNVKILDFGLAGFVSESASLRSLESDASVPARSLTMAGSVMGTPDYIAPEQACDAASADIRADIYSLGCTLYFLLAGCPPFAGETAQEKLKAHSEQDAPDIRALRSDVPDELAYVIRRMLAKDPDQRYQTPQDVAAALAPFARAHTETTGGRRGGGRVPLIVGVAAGVFGFALMATVLAIVTNRGRLEIQSYVDDVKIVVSQDQEEVAVIDLTTGSKVRWLPAGEYEVELAGDDNTVRLSRSRVELSRLGKVVVTADWTEAALGDLPTFDTSQPTISQDGVEVVDDAWKITADETRTVRLFEVEDPNLAPGRFFYRAKLRSENVTERAYLEMWVRIPGIGEAFSKGFHNAISGTNGWAEYEIPFYLTKGQQPDRVKLNVTIEGGGTVWIKDISLRGRTLDEPSEAKPTAEGVAIDATNEEAGASDDASMFANGKTRVSLAELVEAAREASSEDDWKTVVAAYAPALFPLPLDASRGVVRLLSELPDQDREVLMQQGYLRWRADELDFARRATLKSLLGALLEMSPNADPAAIAENQLNARLVQSDAGFAVLNLPDSDDQVVVAYILDRPSKIPMKLTVAGPARLAIHPAIAQAHQKEIVGLLDRPYTGVPPAPVASAATQDAMEALLNAIPGDDDDEAWKTFVENHLPVLHDAPLELARDMVRLAARLPKAQSRQLFQDGHLKWRFPSLAESWQDNIRDVVRASLREGLQQAEEQRAGGENGVIDFSIRQLETADVGFVVVDAPDAADQAVVWFADINIRTPFLLPIYAPDGLTEQMELAATESLSELRDEAYSDLPDQW